MTLETYTWTMFPLLVRMPLHLSNVQGGVWVMGIQESNNSILMKI